MSMLSVPAASRRIYAPANQAIAARVAKIRNAATELSRELSYATTATIKTPIPARMLVGSPVAGMRSRARTFCQVMMAMRPATMAMTMTKIYVPRLALLPFAVTELFARI